LSKQNTNGSIDINRKIAPEVISVLELANVKKYFKENRAVDGISFQLKKGEILGLIGANGAGKTTTLSMIATLSKPDGGYIYYEGQDIVKNPAVLRNALGYVPQEIALYPSLSGKDNLRFWGRANHIRGKILRERIHEVSSIINLGDDILNKKVSSYSGGMKRRLNIGVALLHKPTLIIMDEPTVGLDVESRNQIQKTVIELKNQGAGIIYAGHYMEEMEKICDKFCVIGRGKCILFGDKEELLNGKVSLEQLYLEVTKRNGNVI
jgi:ABC-2 type transport system ATP-binding protein